MPAEADTCRTYILPKLHAAGWEDDFIAEQRVIAPGRIVAYLDGLQAKVDALKQLQAQTRAELDALLPSVLLRQGV